MKLKLLLFFIGIIQIGYSQTAKIQFIHNAPDISIAEVDVYVDDNLVVDNLAFKTGSAFIEIPFDGIMVQITVTSPTDENDILVSRERLITDQENYYVVLNGIFDADSYEDAEPFDLFLYEGARLEAQNTDQGVDLDVMVQHGALGFDNILNVEGTQILAAPIGFGSPVFFSEYSEYYSSWLSNEDIGSAVRESYSVPQMFYFPFNFPLQSENLGLENQAIIMLLTGFRNPEVNNDGEPFNVWYLTPEGGEFRSATLSVDDSTLPSIKIYPNPFQDNLTVAMISGNATAVIYDIQGRIVRDAIFLEETTVIGMSDLKTGVYFIRLTDQKNNASTVRRIIKK